MLKKISHYLYRHWDWYKQRVNNKIAIPIIQEIIAEEKANKEKEKKFKCSVCGFESNEEIDECPDCEGRSDFEAMRTRGDSEPYGEPEYGVHRESGKRCRTCGRTNCEGGSQCEMYAEMHNKD